MWSSLPSLQGVGAKRVVLIVAMCLSVLLHVVVVGVYMHGGHTSSRATAAGARPNAMPEAAEETAAKLLKAEQRAELLLAELLDATNPLPAARPATGTGAWRTSVRDLRPQSREVRVGPH